jgi:hypothetical protein
MPSNTVNTPRFWVVQLAPPLVVARTVPDQVVAKQTDVLGQAMSLSVLVVPEVCPVQVAPPLLVVRIVPPVPTAKQSDVLGHATPRRTAVVPEFWVLQVVPPLVVPMIFPPSDTLFGLPPTAMQAEVLGQASE